MKPWTELKDICPWRRFTSDIQQVVCSANGQQCHQANCAPYQFIKMTAGEIENRAALKSWNGEG